MPTPGTNLSRIRTTIGYAPTKSFVRIVEAVASSLTNPSDLQKDAAAIDIVHGRSRFVDASTLVHAFDSEHHAV